jgi:hypothetical protein
MGRRVNLGPSAQTPPRKGEGGRHRRLAPTLRSFIGAAPLSSLSSSRNSTHPTQPNPIRPTYYLPPRRSFRPGMQPRSLSRSLAASFHPSQHHPPIVGQSSSLTYLVSPGRKSSVTLLGHQFGGLSEASTDV